MPIALSVADGIDYVAGNALITRKKRAFLGLKSDIRTRLNTFIVCDLSATGFGTVRRKVCKANKAVQAYSLDEAAILFWQAEYSATVR